MVSIATLDNYWSKQVKVRDNFRCVRCGSTYSLESHHIMPRSNHSIRWLIKNGVTTCKSCHIYAHNNKKEFEAWARVKYGDDLIDWLKREVNKTDFNSLEYWYDSMKGEINVSKR